MRSLIALDASRGFIDVEEATTTLGRSSLQRAQGGQGGSWTPGLLAEVRQILPARVQVPRVRSPSKSEECT